MYSEYEATFPRFLSYLGETDPSKFTKQHWHMVWAYTKSDFCTWVIDLFKWACVEHDFYFRTHHSFDGKPITFMGANIRYFKRMLVMSNPFAKSGKGYLRCIGKFVGYFNPFAYIRFAGVCLFGRSAWNGKEIFRG